jgi:hypothetical protein
MPYYSLLIADKQKTLLTSAGDRSEALAIFGKELGLKLTLEDDGCVAQYLLDEWQVNPHWLNHTIPVFASPI